MTTPVLYSMAKMSVSGTPGTGPVVLNAAVAGFQTFAASGLLDGQTFSYNITDLGDTWEVGHGVYTAAGTSFVRTPSASSNGGSAINATSNAQVTIVFLNQDLLALLASPPTIGGISPGIGKFLTLILSSLPTSDTGLTSGAIWNNGNFVCIVP